jgi:hypothetical protein
LIRWIFSSGYSGYSGPVPVRTAVLLSSDKQFFFYCIYVLYCICVYVTCVCVFFCRVGLDNAMTIIVMTTWRVATRRDEGESLTYWHPGAIRVFRTNRLVRQMAATGGLALAIEYVAPTNDCPRTLLHLHPLPPLRQWRCQEVPSV